MDDIKIEKDVNIKTRDGSVIVADVIRPDNAGRYPVIISMGPYGKDVHWPDRFPLYNETDQGPHAIWEMPGVEFWVPKGYALLRADSRGTGKSRGKLDLLGPKEAEDCYDVIEWAAVQPWSTGRVGLLGISWYAMAQWMVAALQPPHLVAMIPWEGLTDFYREWGRQGGILNNVFTESWWQRQIVPQINADEVVDISKEFLERETYDDWYREHSPELSCIKIPVLSAANWGALHLHLRGNIEGYLGTGSTYKRLLVHVGTHIGPFYSDRGKQEQVRFLDRWLKNIQNDEEQQPPVRLAIRRGSKIEWRDEREWPLQRTVWTPLYLDAHDGSLQWRKLVEAGEFSYKAPEGSATFLTPPVKEEVEITGPVELKLWVSSSARDMDVFVTLRHIDAKGNEITGIGPQGAPVPMAIGFLRASHRALDKAKSMPGRPYHRHDTIEYLIPGQPTLLDVEIWPTSITLDPGDRLRLDIAASDPYMQILRHDHSADRSPERFAGNNNLYTGSERGSHLILPIIPSE
jgi:predicted acyl esterase